MLHRTTTSLGLITLVALAALLACDNDPSAPACADGLVPALLVSVVDSATSASAIGGATIVARTATTTDSVTVTAGNTDPVGVANERSGTFTLTVRQTGYQTWTKSGIVVTRGACHVNPVDVTARLQR